MSLKPIILHSHVGGPNPWKVNLVLEELGLPYETKIWQFSEMKQEPFVKINPNGRVPAIEDPNTGITLWESCAIVEYLVDRYDKDSKLTYHTEPEKYLVKQWLYFQASGQGPYFGQAAWFKHYHPEKVESAHARYVNEVKRVIGVMDKVLAEREYLVGDRATMADLAFLPWDAGIGFVTDEKNSVNMNEFPHYNAWKQRLHERPAVKKTFEMRAKLLGGQ